MVYGTTHDVRRRGDGLCRRGHLRTPYCAVPWTVAARMRRAAA